VLGVIVKKKNMKTEHTLNDEIYVGIDFETLLFSLFGKAYYHKDSGNMAIFDWKKRLKVQLKKVLSIM